MTLTMKDVLNVKAKDFPRADPKHWEELRRVGGGGMSEGIYHLATFVEGDGCEGGCDKCRFCWGDDDCNRAFGGEANNQCGHGCDGWYVVEDVV